jgi:general secretion pathway protein G
MTRFEKRRRTRGGFTLIEVLLVLAILVIIASLAVVNILPAQRKAKIDSARTQVGAFESAIDLYNLSVDAFPPNLDALRIAPAGLANPAKWDGPYLKKDIPLDPWGQEFKYQVPGVRNPESYDVWSSGPDGVDGNDDDIGNWTQR